MELLFLEDPSGQYTCCLKVSRKANGAVDDIVVSGVHDTYANVMSNLAATYNEVIICMPYA